MEFRCSNSAASLALLAGGMVFALLQPGHCVADPIEFSSSTVPLGVPRAVVQMKDSDSDKFTMPHDAAGGGIMDEAAFMPDSGGGMVITRNARRDSWGTNPLHDGAFEDMNDPFSRTWGQLPEGWLSSSSSSAATNNASALKNFNDRVWGRTQPNDTGMFHRFDNPMYGSKQGNDSLVSRFGVDSPRDGSQQRDGSRFSRDGANGGDSSIWSKIFNHQAGGAGHFAFSHAESADDLGQVPASPFSDHYKPTGIAGGAGFGSVSSEDSMTTPASTGTFFTPADGHSFRDGGQNGSIPGFSGPADPSKPQNWASRSFATKSAQSRAARNSVPERPGVLPMPKRPNDL